jgi:hypothetical protein
MQRRVRNIVYGTFFVAILIAATHLAIPSRDSSRLPIHAAMLDIIRCSPPTHPDEWLRKTEFAPTSAAHDHALEGLLQRTDIYDPNDCGRTITQAMGPKVPLNQGRSG